MPVVKRSARPVSCNLHDELVGKIMRSARKMGLLAHYCRHAQLCSGQQGIPDLIIAGPGGVIFAEVKIPPDETSAEQDLWLWTLTASGHRAVVWGPSQWEQGSVWQQLQAIR